MIVHQALKIRLGLFSSSQLLQGDSELVEKHVLREHLGSVCQLLLKTLGDLLQPAILTVEVDEVEPRGRGDGATAVAI